MLRLRSHLLAAGRAASPLNTAASPVLRCLFFLSTASPDGFVAQDYLVTACGLTPAQAVKSTRRLAHLKSSAKPDAVLAFLADIGLDKSQVVAAVTGNPDLLRAKVGQTLASRVAQLRDIGLSLLPQISCLVTVVPSLFHRCSVVPRIEFYLSLLGSFEKLHTVFKRNPYLLSQDAERQVKPKIALLQQCGLPDSEIVDIFVLAPRMFQSKPERILEFVACADSLGVPRHSAMFKHALIAIASITPEKIAARWDFLKKSLGCSEAELRIAVLKLPRVLNITEGRLSRTVDFLKTEVGLDPNYIVHRPALLGYSLEGRTMPRYYVLKALKAKGFLKKDFDLFGVVARTEKSFAKRFIHPYKDSVPGLADSYAAACTGSEKVPPGI